VQRRVPVDAVLDAVECRVEQHEDVVVLEEHLAHPVEVLVVAAVVAFAGAVLALALVRRRDFVSAAA